MKSILMPAALAIALATGLTSAPIQAAGCLKGAAVGGVAGHFAGHHGLLGAGAGCVIGRHEQTSTRVNVPSRTERLAAAVSQATPARLPPFATAKAPVVPKECHAARGASVRSQARPS
jgi:hypothetical protein